MKQIFTTILILLAFVCIAQPPHEIDVFGNARLIAIESTSKETGKSSFDFYHAYGAAAQVLINEELHQFEFDASFIVNEGLAANMGIYLNTLFFFHDLHPRFRDKRNNVRWLNGLGIGYDNFIDSTDYYIDSRLSIGQEILKTAFKLQIGTRFNIVDASNFGLMLTNYATLSVDLF